MNVKDIKLRIIKAGEIAVEQLIKVAKEDIINHGSIDGMGDELSADKLKNAAATKKLAIFDAFEILDRIEEESANISIEEEGAKRTDTKKGFAELHAGK